MSILVATTNGNTAEFPDGTDPSVIQAAMAKQFGSPQASDSNSPAEPTFMGNLPAAIGQGMTDAALGAGQFVANAPPFNLVPGLAGQFNASAKEKAQLDAPLLAAPGGTTGSAIGNMAALAPAAGVGGIGTGVLRALTSGALQGGLAGVAQPVSAEDYAAEKAKQVATGAAAGGVVGGGLSALGKGVQALLPQNIVGTLINKLGGGDAAHAAEGEALAQRTGIDLRPSEVTGQPQQAMAENLARQSITSRNLAFQSDQKVAQQWLDYTNRALDGISSQPGDMATVGQRVQGAVKNAIDDLTKRRDLLANQEYGDIRTITKGAATIEPQNTNQLLQQIVSDYGNVGTPSADALANFAKKNLANVAPAPKLTNAEQGLLDMLQKVNPAQQQMMLQKVAAADPQVAANVQQAMGGVANATAPAQGNLDKLMQLRQFASKVASGQAKISGDNIDRRIGAQMLESIGSDLDAASQSLPGDVGAMLKQANSHFAEASGKIEGIQNSALGKLVGPEFVDAINGGTFNQIPGATVVQKIASMQPEQLAMTKGILQNSDPDVWQSVKRAYFEDAVQKAQQMPPSLGARTVAANPGKFLNEIGNTPEDSARLVAMLDPAEHAQISDAMDAARRLAGRIGYNTSGTAPWSQAMALLSTIPRAIAGDPTAVPQAAAQVIIPRSIANIMLNSDGRAAVQKLSRLPPGSAKFRQVAAQLAAISQAQDVNPPTQGSQ